MSLNDSSVTLAEKVADSGEMEVLFSEAYDYWEPQRGDIVRGRIIQITPHEILVDIGSKSEGVVTERDFQYLDPGVLEQLQVGDEVLVYVVNPEDENGNILLSLSLAQLESDWQAAEERFQKGEVFQATITGCNKGGLLVHLGKVRGFLPASQIDRSHWGNNNHDQDLGSRLAAMVGQQLPVKIIELDRKRNRLILSERAALSQYRREQKAKLLAELQEGEIRHGVVTNLCDFGAFVDLGGADGLIHLSELSWGYISRPHDVLRVGQEVDVYILSVDRERGRIGLSLKRLQPEPWSRVDEMYEVGQLVEGEVTNLTKFGAFVRLADSNIEGLIHISELSDDPTSPPEAVVQKGDRLTVKIIHIDSERQRMGLSLKAAASLEQEPGDEETGEEEMAPEEEDNVE